MIHLREKEDPFTFKEAHMILKTLLKGLDDCHVNGVIHRDLKPQNVILSPQTLEPKIIDFGLSLYCHSKVEMKKFKRCGTMGYMAY
jgi:serine/threonine protein kinase